MEAIAKGVLSALLTYALHYGVVKTYTTVCVPDGVWGFLHGMVSTGSPVCQAGVQVMTATQVSYSAMVLSGVTRFVVDVIASK